MIKDEKSANHSNVKHKNLILKANNYDNIKTVSKPNSKIDDFFGSFSNKKRERNDFNNVSNHIEKDKTNINEGKKFK
jgi:hypothetical protein